MQPDSRPGARAWLLTAMGAALLIGGVPVAPPVRAAQAAPIVFTDTFDGPTLDRDRWNVIVTGRTVNNEQQAYVDSPETVDIVTGADAQGAEGGALRLRARYRPGFTTAEGRPFDFISGRLDTNGKVDFLYGTAAARMKLMPGAGLWPAFWALGVGRWPDVGEMDIMENVGDPSWTNVALHGPGYSGNTPLVARRSFPPDHDISAWHVYAVDWTPERLVFTVDGDVFYTATREMVEAHGRWAYDTPKYLIVNLALGGQYPQGVNHVEQPYAGLPATTVDLIKADRAAVLVDWVRITRP